jgi:hypothetical protein
MANGESNRFDCNGENPEAKAPRTNFTADETRR